MLDYRSVVKMDHFPRDRVENEKNETTTLKEVVQSALSNLLSWRKANRNYSLGRAQTLENQCTMKVNTGPFSRIAMIIFPLSSQALGIPTTGNREAPIYPNPFSFCECIGS